MSVDSTDSIKEYTPENRHQKKQKKTEQNLTGRKY